MFTGSTCANGTSNVFATTRLTTFSVTIGAIPRLVTTVAVGRPWPKNGWVLRCRKNRKRPSCTLVDVGGAIDNGDNGDIIGPGVQGTLRSGTHVE